MRFLRFSYIIPRLVALVLLLLVTEFGSGYVLRWVFVSGGEASIGAKVDIASVQASLLETRVAISDLAIANPRSPMNNLVEADRVEIDFDSAALLRKKLVADYGIVSGLEFSTPRETSGALPEQAQPETGEPTESWAAPIVGRYAESWLTDLEGRLTTDVERQLRSVELAKQLSTRWPQQYKQLEAQAAKIKADAKQLELEVRSAKQNPLRHMESLSKMPERVTNLRREMRDLQTVLATLPGQLKSDRQAVLEARSHDEEWIRQKLDLKQVDSRELAGYLLGEQISGPLQETIGWVRWARAMVPSRGEQVVASKASRGEDVFFAGCQPLPNMLIKAVRLDGMARLDGQPVELVGVVRDWTNQPELHGQPTTLELTTRGGLPLSVVATFDRTGREPHDHLVCSTRDLAIPAAALGREGKLRFDVAPSRADIQLTLDISGDQLLGSMQIAQRGLQMTPSAAAGRFDQQLQKALAANVGRIDQARTTIDIHGSLDHPEFDLESSLATGLADALHRSAMDMVATERARLLERGQQEVDQQLAKVDREFTAFQAKLTKELAGPGEILASLLGQRGGDTQVGSSPFGQIFK